MDNEALRFLLERKLDFLKEIAQACMLWWVSSVVFCGTVIAAVWSKWEKLKEQKVIRWLGIVLCVFFSSIVAFGYLVIVYLWNLEIELADVAKKLNLPDRNFQYELLTFRRAIWAGTSSFILVWIAWILMWVKLSKRVKRKRGG